jgi:uncharacterized protein YkwD
MLRLVFIAVLIPALAGCSLGTPRSLSLGYADNGAPSSETRTGLFSQGLTPRTPSRSTAETNRNQRVAALDTGDTAKPYAKAPKGALSDRDYSQATLDKTAAMNMINAYRRQKGLGVLKWHDKLERAARLHSTDLAKWDRISHYGSDGSNPWDRVKRVGFKARLAAENVGTGQANLEEVFKGWQESPGHNKNLLLADATHMGLVLVTDPKTEFKTFWTLVLGTPL